MGKSNTLDDRVATVIHADSPVSTGPPGDAVGGGNGLTRVTVNLNPQAMRALEQISSTTKYSKTDTINRALQIYAIVQQIMDRDGGVLRIQHQDGEVERIHIV